MKNTVLSLDRYHVLVEFAYKHLDFQMEELQSILEMHGIKLGEAEDCCQLVELPDVQGVHVDANKDPLVASNTADASDANATTTDDATPTVDATPTSADATNPTAACHPIVESKRRRPYVILSLPPGSKFVPKPGEFNDPKSLEKTNNIASIILDRCVLVRSVMELWGMGNTLTACTMQTECFISSALGSAYLKDAMPQSWKLTIHTLGTKYSVQEQEILRSQFRFLNLRGPVRMKDPDNEYVLIQELELDAKGSPAHARRDATAPADPIAYYFCRALNGGRPVKGRGLSEQYGLNKRSYLGPTSMDPELSFIMTNLGKIEKGSIVMDPFVGTGSILISCALRGAYCIGTDIDIRVLRGRSEKENVFTNFDQFALPRPELIRSDNALYHRHYRTDTPLYDAIITDPPYGIRAGARKTGSKREDPRPVLEEHRHDHIPQTKPYAVSDVMSDLLDMAARTLVMGGRLVYIIPSFRHFDEEVDLPMHPCLRTVCTCYQPLQAAELGRRMVAMEKVTEYNPDLREQYLSITWKNGPESAEKCANIREKLIEAARQKPGYEERFAIRKKKRQENRLEKKKRKRKESQESS